TGGGPNVWVSNPFSNDGVRTATVACSRNTTTNAPQASASCPLTLATQVLTITYPSNRLFDVDPAMANQVTLVPQNPANSTNNIAPGFEVPSQWRASFEIHQAAYFGLANPFIFSAAVLYSKTQNEAAWRDLRAGHQIGTAPDG